MENAREKCCKISSIHNKIQVQYIYGRKYKIYKGVIKSSRQGRLNRGNKWMEKLIKSLKEERSWWTSTKRIQVQLISKGKGNRKIMKTMKKKWNRRMEIGIQK